MEVWHPRDTNVISEQKLRLARDRDRHVVAAWHVAENRIVPLGTNVKETMQLPRSGTRAMALDDTPYESTGMFGRHFTDVYKVDLTTGARAKVATKLSPPVWPSPGGRYVLNFKDGEFWIYDLESRRRSAMSARRRAYRSSIRRTTIPTRCGLRGAWRGGRRMMPA